VFDKSSIPPITPGTPRPSKAQTRHSSGPGSCPCALLPRPVPSPPYDNLYQPPATSHQPPAPAQAAARIRPGCYRSPCSQSGGGRSAGAPRRSLHGVPLRSLLPDPCPGDACLSRWNQIAQFLLNERETPMPKAVIITLYAI
jgi:hypothetical protein